MVAAVQVLPYKVVMAIHNLACMAAAVAAATMEALVAVLMEQVTQKRLLVVVAVLAMLRQHSLILLTYKV